MRIVGVEGVGKMHRTKALTQKQQRKQFFCFFFILDKFEGWVLYTTT